MSSFSVKTGGHEGNAILNICDDDLLGRSITDGARTIEIGGYYRDRLVDREEAARLLVESQIINMVGERTVRLALELEVGAEDGIRRIDGVPFLLVFKI